METNHLLSIPDLQQDLVPLSIICFLLFILGYWLGTLKSKKLIRKMAKMEKKIMDLNSELLYGTDTFSRMSGQKIAPGTTGGR